MNVPNHERKAFKDMTPEERSAIVEAWLVDGVEVFGVTEWLQAASGHLLSDLPYRTRPRQLVIPWDVIKPEYKWAAMDESRFVCFYESKPIITGLAWVPTSKNWSGSPLNIDTTGIDWRESLVQRPDGV